jgi:predicted outer membrane protein
MTIKMFFAALGTLALLSTGVAHAQTATTDKPAVAKKVQAPRTEKSLECSKQADEKGLHGKPRKKFMSSCKKA